MKRFTAFILFLSVIIGFSTCKKERLSLEDEFFLFVEYWNEDGQTPSLLFDEFSTSPEIKIDFSTTFTGIVIPPNAVEVLINNIRIVDNENVNYEINSISAYEYRSDLGDWKEDVEFIMNFDQVQDLDVMLILDASLSLGNDFEKIKGYATNFVSQLFEQTPSVELGVISFSDEIRAFAPSNNQNAIQSFINGIQQGTFTPLYEALNAGIDTLMARQSKGKAILTFTDGTDNFSISGIDPETILNKLLNDPNPVKVNSFTIGLEGNGGVDRSILENVAANGGIAAFPANTDELGDVFNKFSKAISNVYDLSYRRSQNTIPEIESISLRFDILAKPK